MEALAAVDRFWRKVDVREHWQCWLWRGTTSELDYGLFWHEGQNWRAHRLAYLWRFGPFDLSLVACHRCDCPSCVNPLHIFIGNHADNVADRERKGRGAHSK